MPLMVRINADDVDDLLSTEAYGPGAVIRLERSTVADSGFAEVGSVPLVLGTRTYEVWDPTGSSSHWYRTRYTSPSAGTSSEYSPPFWAGVRGWTDLAQVKRRLNIADTDETDDGFLLECIDAVNDWMTDYIGAFLGPSASGEQTYDVTTATRRIRIPEGIRTVSQVEIATETGGTFTTADTDDYLLRPLAPRAGEPYTELLLTGIGTTTYFSRGYATVRISGTFGYPQVPPRLAEVATRMAVLRFQGRNTGEGGGTGSEELGISVIYQTLPNIHKETLERARLSVDDFAYV